jgi:hypothetical protein
MTPALWADYRWCRDVMQRHYENFAVASRIVPAALRPHFWAVYAYARTVDDLGDEYADDPNRRVGVGGKKRRVRYHHGPPQSRARVGEVAPLGEGACFTDPYGSCCWAHRVEEPTSTGKSRRADSAASRPRWPGSGYRRVLRRGNDIRTTA